MRFEVLKRSNLKRNIIIGVVVVAIIIVCVITLTRAKYRTVASTTLIKGDVNYTLADLNIVAITLDDASVDALPEGGYYNLLDDSYCEVDGSPISVTLSWDNDTQALSVTPFTTRGTKCYLDFETATTKTVDTVLGEIVVNLDEPTLTRISCENGTNTGATTRNCGVSENGIYEGEDDYGPTYYYRGTINYNWVEFAGFYWRIIRINGDGTVRLIYSGEVDENNDGVQESNITGSGTQIDTSAFNSSYYRSYYAGYTYTEDQQRPTDSDNEEDSIIKAEIDEWYATYLLNYEDYLADSGFCNDREVTSGTWRASGNGDTFYHAAHTRWSSGTPTFKCYKDAETADGSGYADLYTVNINNGIGNGALEYPIGLITADEVMYAGGGYINTSSNYGYWLYTGEDYWTMSPFRFYSAGYISVFSVGSTGRLNLTNTDREYGVRPVINIRSDVTVSGFGTETEPYTFSLTS